MKKVALPILIVSVLFLSGCLYEIPNVECMLSDERYDLVTSWQHLLNVLKHYFIYVIPFLPLSIIYLIIYLKNNSSRTDNYAHGWELLFYILFSIFIIQIFILTGVVILSVLGIVGDSMPSYLLYMALAISVIITILVENDFIKMTKTKELILLPIYSISFFILLSFGMKACTYWTHNRVPKPIYFKHNDRLTEKFSKTLAGFKKQNKYISSENCWIYFEQKGQGIIEYKLIIRNLREKPFPQYHRKNQIINIYLLDDMGESIGNFDISLNKYSWNFDCNYFEGTTDKISQYGIETVSNIFIEIPNSFGWIKI